jgi:phage terminase large subunit
LEQAANQAWLDNEIPRVFLPLIPHKRFKGARGGRGSAKSHFFAGQMVTRAMKEPGLRAVCVREVQKSLELSSKSTIEGKIRQLNVEPYFRILKDRIITPGNGLIIFQGMQDHTADSIKSLEGFKIAWVEEAHRISERSLRLLRPTIRPSTDDGELWFSWNPESENDPVDQMLWGPDRAPEKMMAVIHANWYDNPWFGGQLREEMEWDRRRDPEKYAHVWLGEYQRNTEARVFRNFTVREFILKRDTTYHYGADWGFATDPSVLVKLAVDEPSRKIYIEEEAYAVGCEIDDTPALFAGFDTRNPPRWPNKFGWRGIAGAQDWPIIGDSARPETISHLNNRGFKIKPARKGAGSVEEGVKFLQNFDIVIHPRCKHTIDEFTHYSWKIDPKTEKVLPILEDKKNHVIDAARYALEDLRRYTGEASTGAIVGLY